MLLLFLLFSPVENKPLFVDLFCKSPFKYTVPDRTMRSRDVRISQYCVVDAIMITLCDVDTGFKQPI